MSFYSNLVCGTCDRSSACNFPCNEYSDASYSHHKQKETESIKNTIKSLCTESHNPPVPRVSGFGTSVKSGDLLGFGLTPEKKKILKEIMGSCSGKASLSEMVMANRNHCENDIEDFLEYDVSRWEYFLVMKGKKSFVELIDRSSFLFYLEEQNRIYCEQEGLCPECRNSLKEFTEYEDGMISEMYWACSKGC
jgi:hypothetical protein